MAKLIFLFSLYLASTAHAATLKLEFIAESTLPKKIEFEKKPVGGLSGMFWDGKRLRAVSDDRGRFGGSRIYDLDFKMASGKVEFSVSKMIRIKAKSKAMMDLEGMVVLPDGTYVVSSEGDNNAKPRVPPSIFLVGSDGEFKADLPLPDRFIPEAAGLQKKGIETNRGFEGLTSSTDGTQLYAMNEAPIMGDQADLESSVQWLRLLHLEKAPEGTWRTAEEWPYLIAPLSKNSEGPEVFRGVSEILLWKDKKFLVLERGARLSSHGIRYTAAIYLTDFQGTKDVSKIGNLSAANVSSPRKEKLVDLEEVLTKSRLENFEALTWGPALPDGRRTLLVLSDNNFSSKERTQLLVFAVKEVE